MPINTQGRDEPPAHLTSLVPSVAAFQAALMNAVESLPANAAVYRAAGDPKHLLPETLVNAYRFGPPRELRQGCNALPYAWLYVAMDAQTAIWESRFARTDATCPGQFYLDPAAVETGVVGHITFGRDLRLWNLTGQACAKLGVQDTISSSDHEACHWIGHSLRKAMLGCDAGTVPDGVIYPSRRMRGHQAIALRGELLPELRMHATVHHELFAKTAAYAALIVDPLYGHKPNPTLPMHPLPGGRQR